MRWSKLGRVYVPDGSQAWAQHYAFPPTPYPLDADLLRLYVCFCDRDTVGRVGYVDVRADDPREVVRVSQRPVLDIGEPGTFDENGVLPTCVLPVADQLYLYYVGYQLGAKVKYFQFQGLAVSSDGGESFERASRVPVLERSDTELLNRTSAFVMPVDGRFRIWYVGGSEWTTVDEKPLPVYNMRTLDSDDGINWGAEGQVCIDFEDDDEHAFGRPWVIELGGTFHMFYSVRTRSKDYRLGLARSEDLVNWKRCDGEVGIDVSDEGWDSEMIAYASVVRRDDDVFMFYNGNERGRTGFGCAVLEES